MGTSLCCHELLSACTLNFVKGLRTRAADSNWGPVICFEGLFWSCCQVTVYSSCLFLVGVLVSKLWPSFLQHNGFKPQETETREGIFLECFGLGFEFLMSKSFPSAVVILLSFLLRLAIRLLWFLMLLGPGFWRPMCFYVFYFMDWVSLPLISQLWHETFACSLGSFGMARFLGWWYRWQVVFFSTYMLYALYTFNASLTGYFSAGQIIASDFLH